MVTVGIDEVGRGCWAGPLVAGAVALPDSFAVGTDAGWLLDDSKKLSRAARMQADAGIRQIALGVGLGWVSSAEIDRIGLTKAVSLAMRRALDAVHVPYESIIVDGNINYLPDVPAATALVKADATVPAVSAASIVAKVARDRWMETIAAPRYPDYGFERHVGYGTAAHKAALERCGVTPIHRRSFRPVRLIADVA